MAKQSHLQSLKTLLSPKNNERTSAHELLFLGQMLLLSISLIATSEALLYVNKHNAIDNVANQRYSMLQAFSDRINDTLQSHQLGVDIINRYALSSEQYRQDDGNLSQTKLLLDTLKQQLPAYQSITLLDQQGNVVISAGEHHLQQLPVKRLKAAINRIRPGEVLLSPMALYGANGEAHLWAVTPVQSNDKGVSYLLISFEISNLWSSFYTIDYGKNTSMFLVDQQGQFINLIEAGHRGRISLEELFPRLWSHMDNSGFGRFENEDAITIFIKLRPGNEDSIYVVSLLTNDSLPLLPRYHTQFRILTLLLIILIFKLLLVKRRHKKYWQKGQKAIELAQQLYQANAGALLFNAEGYCISSNQQIVDVIGQTSEQLDGRRFSRLFNSERSQTKMIWQLARSSGLWNGQLQLTSDVNTTLDISLRPIILGRGEFCMLLQLEEHPHHRKQARQFKRYQQLADSGSGLALIDSKHKIISANQTLASICKIPSERLLDASWLQLLAVNHNELIQMLEKQLATRHSWQGQLWIKASDATICRCIANIQVAESRSEDENLKVLTLTPIHDLALCNEDGIEKSNQRCNPIALFAGKAPQYSLLLVNIDNNDIASSFASVDRILYHHHQILKALNGFLPDEALVGDYRTPSEIDILLPNYSDTQSVLLAMSITQHLDKLQLGQGVTIGIAQSYNDIGWEQLRNDALAGVHRARLSDLKFCQVHTQ